MSPDEETLKRAVNGDSAAFSKVVDLCYGSIFRFAMKYTGHRQDAEDIAQQACIKLGKSIRSFRFEAAFSSWLYPLVLNCARDWYRQQTRHQSAADQEHVVEQGASTAGESQIYLGQVLRQVEFMGEGFKDALVLVAGEGMSHLEAAELLGVKESTISWRLHEIRKKLASAKV